jgi:hypothetical protein
MDQENKQYESISKIYDARAHLIKTLITLKQNNFSKEDLLKDIKIIYNDIDNNNNNNNLKWDDNKIDENEDLIKKYYTKPDFFKENKEGEYENFYKRAKERNYWDLIDIIWDYKCKNSLEAFDILVCIFLFF